VPLIDVNQIEVGERFRRDLGDVKGLAESIREVGLLHPIVVTPDLKLVCGRRRLEAFKHLGRSMIPATILDLEDVRRGEIQENQARKDFTVKEMAEIYRYLKPELEVEARARRGIRRDLGRELPSDSDGGRTDDKIARFCGISRDTLRKVVFIVEAAEAEPELYGPILRDADAGRKKIDRAYKDVVRRMRQQKRKEGVPLPPGVYDVILADPPWRYAHGAANRGKAEMHYPTMDLDEIINLPIQEHVADDAALFLWSTNPFLPDALKVMEAWCFRYVTNICWVKQRFGTGWYVRGQHELLLIGVRGRIGVPADEDRPPSVIHAPAGRHSEKPAEVYEVIERMHPRRRYLELFARRTRPGWTSWGDEIS